MPSVTDIICVQFPPLIRIELKEKYKDWHGRCSFHRVIPGFEETATSLLVISAELLQDLAPDCKYRKLIAFGQADLLESSYMLGVDDYLKDPWNCSELLIRCSKFLSDSTLQIDGNNIQRRGNSFFINRIPMNLSPTQQSILRILFDNPNIYFTYSDIRRILPQGSLGSEPTLYVHIHQIRRRVKEMLPASYNKSINIKNSNSRGYALLLACG